MWFADSFSPSSSGPTIPIESDIEGAYAAFRAQEPVLIHDFDDREGETDLVYPAAGVTAQNVARMRNDAGGLICVALSDEVATAFDLPFLSEELSHPSSETADLEYDERSSFSITVNHRETFTGVTDVDRALTISELGVAADEPETTDFGATFRSPGHVSLLRGAPNLLRQRRGHTELGLALASSVGCAPAVVVCEMLDDDTGRALSKEGALRYARIHDIPFVTGADLLEAVGSE
ncbi:3,4-dihydroxy-2-butanone-4-phosphate synthase [Natrarchaeobius sp. A-rgal3]|uniref:3,4-dihydroxy-2-butanone-4-phosphate synthase n=1 Tax=Natrarchaeobius versutus TaxID=1679078 RepID=UPI00350F9F84